MTTPRSPISLIRLALCLAATSLVLLPDAGEAQEVGRIWGRVGTVDGDTLEGFLRWDRNEASWVDVLDGSKPLVWETVREWVPDSTLEVTSRDRVIEYGGYRITWDDAEADFPSTAESGVRFGHIRRIDITGDQEVELTFRSGEAQATGENPIITHTSAELTTILQGGSTDLGTDFRELLVDAPGHGVVKLKWSDLEWVELGPAPEGARPRGERLWGTVEDRSGDSFTGAISWDADESLSTDILDGEAEGGRDREIPFHRITSIRPWRDGSVVILERGDTLFLTDSDDVDDDNRTIQISDPGLGLVQVEWDELEIVRFHPPGEDALARASYDAFAGGRRLRGTVVTRTGDELTGLIRWDADEEYAWELLDSRSHGVTYDIELAQVASIQRDADGEVLVTLLDGRILEVEGSNDVNEQNKGILVKTAEMEAADDAKGPRWIRVRWDDFRAVHFRP